MSVPSPTPNLDDRRFDDLVEDMLARIPAHTPEWTHPREGDPGRTLVELFAWLGDTLLYRANLVPERQRLVFLRLLGQRLRPARPARTVVALSHAQPLPPQLTTIRPGGRVEGPLPFETGVETSILPLTAEAYIKRPLDEAEHARMGELIGGLARLHGVRGAVSGYQTRALFDEGHAVPAGIDVFGDSLDHALWLALLAPEADEPEDQPALNARVRDLVGGKDAPGPAQLSVGLVPAIARPAPFEDIGPRARIPVQWEVTAPGDARRPVDYQTLLPIAGSDTTAGLTRPGTLRIALPRSELLWAPSNDVGENPMAGVGDTPPRLDDEAKAARLVAWLRLRPAEGQPHLALRLAWIGINAVEIEQRQTLGGQILGQSTGAADQVFRLPQGQVDPGTLVVQVEDTGGRGYLAWERVDDLAAISADPNIARDAPAYELDAAEGTVRFGDGVRGRVPEPQMRVRLAQGRFGGGSAGNLPAGTLAELSARQADGQAAPALAVHQPLPTEGGIDAETLDEAERRIPSWLNHRDRAVTEDDYRRLAYETPGIEVGRVEVLPRFKPRSFGMAGVVSVMALPAKAISGPPAPRPDRPFLETLHAHLSARVPLTTELYVIGCEYVPLGLSVAVRIREGFGREEVLHEVREALRRLLWPLAPGGVDGEGWPLGRTVRDRELEVEVSRVPGVRELVGIRLFGRDSGPDGDDWRELSRAPRDGGQRLALEPWQLPELLALLVVDAGDDDGADGDMPPSHLRALPNPFASDRAVAVPVVPEVC